MPICRARRRYHRREERCNRERVSDGQKEELAFLQRLGLAAQVMYLIES
jgi:hypothetical protein